MARNRIKVQTPSMLHQVKLALDAKLAIGQSKHADKIYGTTSDKIYSWDTYRSYLKHDIYFAKWAKVTHDCKTLEDARQYANEWLKTRSELSPYTQKLEASALAKLYGCSTREFEQTKERIRSGITRSRGEKVRDKDFSEFKNREFIDFCKSTGLRRKEITYLKGSQLIDRDGKYYIGVRGKGGRYREILIIGNVKEVVDRMKNAGYGRAWDKIPSHADIHGYRADYATAIYKAHERHRDQIPSHDKYYCRGDLKGVCYDKEAMKEASHALGHNRISVIAGHYIR